MPKDAKGHGSEKKGASTRRPTTKEAIGTLKRALRNSPSPEERGHIKAPGGKSTGYVTRRMAEIHAAYDGKKARGVGEDHPAVAKAKAAQAEYYRGKLKESASPSKPASRRRK